MVYIPSINIYLRVRGEMGCNIHIYGWTIYDWYWNLSMYDNKCYR